MKKTNNRPLEPESEPSGSPRRSENPDAKVQDVFLAELNHKLRTPLNAIIGFAELLALQPAGHRSTGDVQQILKSARELLRIIERELAEPNEGLPQPAGAIIPVVHACDVLYVEDDIVNFTLVERILELRQGLSVMHAVRGELGIQFAEAYQPRLILLDLNLPDMHGAEVLRRIQQEPKTAHIPVVILSADASPSQIERLLTAGAKNYLTKPFDLDPFLAVIDEFIAESRSKAPSLALVS
jgi:CheY-like chemotaxis protein